jgi:hypothetical protein
MEKQVYGYSTSEKDVTRGVGLVFSSYVHLKEMLAQGWQIEPPVYVRPRWRSVLRAQKENAYHFILWDGSQVNLVSVIDCPEIQQFLVDQRLPTDYV